VFGVELDGAALFSMVFSIFVLSVGAPGIPGSGLICLSVLLTQLGVPAEALSLVMGIDSLLGMFRVAVNSTGDVAVSLIVAKTEGLLDVEQYNDR
jgi:Na+/H+-dicarboxylate symporter